MKNSVIRSLIQALQPPAETPPLDTSLQESPGRSRGDAARDAGDFAGAVEGYREHLVLHPNDFPIWVQLGHMLKDTGRPVEADHAYGRALVLRPDDADLLLHAGSLRLSLGKPKAAVKLLRRCAETNPSGDVLAKLMTAEVAKHLTDGDRRMIAAAVSRSLSSRLTGLTLHGCSGLVPFGDGRFRFSDDDPQLTFGLDDLGEQTRLAGLRITMRSEARPVRGRLYVDFGDGIDATESLWLAGKAGTSTVDIVVPLAEPGLIRSVRWDPDDKTNDVTIESLSLAPLDFDVALATVTANLPPDVDLTPDATGARAVLAQPRMTAAEAQRIIRLLTSHLRAQDNGYAIWRRRWIEPRAEDYPRIQALTEALAVKPTFSFVIPVYNPPIQLLKECIDSLLAQTYPHFEICLADDRSPDPRVLETLQRYAQRDPRIKIAARAANGHISAASNSALALATGDFVVLVDHDDVIPDYALFVVADHINRYPNAQVLFSDEDKITVSGDRFEPYFKGTFDPWLMFGHNMVSHLGVYRRDLLERIGGFRLGLEGSQDYDLLLRCWEQVGDDAIVHIPHVLYHWRVIPGSTSISADQKGYAITAAQNAINGHFARTGTPLLSVDGFAPGTTAIQRTRNDEALVSIIIPTRDGLDDLSACIASILRHDHRATEILIVDNGSEQPETLAYLEDLAQRGVATILRHPQPFNFSEINNLAAAQARGEVLCFLNNDTETVTKDWLDRARILLTLPQVGVVGARLLYPDGAIQHFGVHVGTADHGVASHPHHGQPANHPGYFGKARLTQQFSAVTAACLFIRRAVFDQVGGFDPDLRVAYNDVDLCLKVRKAGLQVVADAGLVLIHKESRTRGSDADGEKAARLEREAALMRERWGTTLAEDPFYSPNHALDGHFGLANPPRVPMPWREGDRDEASPRPFAGRKGPKRVAIAASAG